MGIMDANLQIWVHCPQIKFPQLKHIAFWCIKVQRILVQLLGGVSVFLSLAQHMSFDLGLPDFGGGFLR